MRDSACDWIPCADYIGVPVRHTCPPSCLHISSCERPRCLRAFRTPNYTQLLFELPLIAKLVLSVASRRNASEIAFSRCIF